MSFLTVAIATATNMSAPITMGQLYVWAGIAFCSLLALVLAIGKWFLNTQVLDELHILRKALTDLTVAIAVLTERVENMKDRQK